MCITCLQSHVRELVKCMFAWNTSSVSFPEQKLLLAHLNWHAVLHSYLHHNTADGYMYTSLEKGNFLAAQSRVPESENV